MFEDGESYVEKKKVDDFFMIFNGNCSLRESCYRCKYCGTERIADFTLADFWGVTEERASVTEQHNGISLLLCNSIRAKDLLPDLRDRAKIIEIDPSEAIPFNNALVAPNKRPSIREKYFKLLNSGVDFRLIVLRLFWKNRLKEKIKSWVGEERINIIKRKLSK